MLFVGLLVVVALVVTWVYGVLDVVTADPRSVRALPRNAWLAVVVLGLTPGALLWLLLGRPVGGPAAATRTRAEPPPAGPDDDAAFQAQLRKRVEEQRRKAEEQRRDNERE